MAAFQRRPQQQVVVADRQARAGRQPALRVDQLLQHPPQPGRGDRLSGERLLQLQVQARHMDAARVRVAQVDRDVDAGGHLQWTARARHPQRQRDRLHADPVERARLGGGIGGDIGQAGACGGAGHGGPRRGGFS
jgi:hypothetical protein